MPEPRFTLTVSRDLWDEMAQEIYPAFADSYLTGAKETATTLKPHTVTAYLRLNGNQKVKAVLQRRGLKLIEPLPFGHAHRPDSQRSE